MYRIAKDVRLPSRSADRSLAGLCDCRRDAEGGRKDQRDGAWFDRNRLQTDCSGGLAHSGRCTEATLAESSVELPGTTMTVWGLP